VADRGDEERIEQALTAQQAQLDSAFDRVREVAPSLVGLAEAEAFRVARDSECSMRVVIRDGEGLMVTADYKLRRIDVAVRGGTVVECLLSPPPDLLEMHRRGS
jgi:hypothetical protein